jgi:CheY-like chemotaxis protein
LGLEQEADLILLDVQMPGLDGLGACRALRADARLAATPIVMLTAGMDQETSARCLAAGATGCLAKPFTVAALRARVQGWLVRTPGAP